MNFLNEGPKFKICRIKGAGSLRCSLSSIGEWLRPRLDIGLPGRSFGKICPTAPSGWVGKEFVEESIGGNFFFFPANGPFVAKTPTADFGLIGVFGFG